MLSNGRAPRRTRESCEGERRRTSPDDPCLRSLEPLRVMLGLSTRSSRSRTPTKARHPRGVVRPAGVPFFGRDEGRTSVLARGDVFRAGNPSAERLSKGAKGRARVTKGSPRDASSWRKCSLAPRRGLALPRRRLQRAGTGAEAPARPRRTACCPHTLAGRSSYLDARTPPIAPRNRNVEPAPRWLASCARLCRLGSQRPGTWLLRGANRSGFRCIEPGTDHAEHSARDSRLTDLSRGVLLLPMAAIAVLATHCGSSSVATTRTGDGGDQVAATMKTGIDGGRNGGDLSASVPPLLSGGVACEGSAPDASASAEAVHRAQPVTCNRTLTVYSGGLPGPEVPIDASLAPCTTNADCVTATVDPSMTCAGGACGFDECVTDAECPSGPACLCADTPGGGTFRPVNRCVAAQCRLDSDCRPGQLCSPSVPNCADPGGFYCHSPAGDTCFDPTTDCAACQGTQCMYLPQVGHFFCAAAFTCGI